jgi:hypothetical protein
MESSLRLWTNCVVAWERGKGIMLGQGSGAMEPVGQCWHGPGKVKGAECKAKCLLPAADAAAAQEKTEWDA